MSDQAMKDAQLAQAQQENAQLMAFNRNASAQLSSQKQCIDEYINANLALRAANLLQEDDLRALKGSMAQFGERIVVLEEENKKLKAELELSKNPQSEAA